MVVSAARLWYVGTHIVLGVAWILTGCISTCDVTQEVSPCTEYLPGSDHYLDCYNRSITALTPAWFPCGLLTLNLDRNFLPTVLNSSFTHLTSLTSLSLAWCEIEAIEIGTFDTLDSLLLLDISFNKLVKALYSSIPKSLFYQMPLLQTLKMSNQENDPSDSDKRCFVYKTRWICSSKTRYLY